SMGREADYPSRAADPQGPPRRYFASDFVDALPFSHRVQPHKGCPLSGSSIQSDVILKSPPSVAITMRPAGSMAGAAALYPGKSVVQSKVPAPSYARTALV